MMRSRALFLALDIEPDFVMPSIRSSADKFYPKNHHLAEAARENKVSCGFLRLSPPDDSEFDTPSR
jgi:hypothetical protein